MSQNLKRALQITLSVAISLGFIWYSLRVPEHVDDVTGKLIPAQGALDHLGDIWKQMLHADMRWVLAYLAILFVVHFLRVVRWGILLEPLAKVTLSDLNKLGAVGFMILMILPFRLGEFGRPLLVARHLKVSRSASLASVVFERIVDGLAMALLLVILLWTAAPGGADGAWVKRGAMLVTVLFGGGLVALVFAVKMPAPTQALVRHTVGRLAPKIAERIIGMMQAFTDGLNVLPSVAKAVEFFGLTAIYWFTNGCGLIVIGWAFGMHITLVHCFTILGLQVIGAMIPGGPGGVGTFQVFTQKGVTLFLGGVPGIEDIAPAYANTIWLLQFLQQVLYGLFFVAIGHIDLHGLIGMSGGEDEHGGPSDKGKGPDDSDKGGKKFKMQTTSP